MLSLCPISAILIRLIPPPPPSDRRIGWMGVVGNVCDVCTYIFSQHNYSLHTSLIANIIIVYVNNVGVCNVVRHMWNMPRLKLCFLNVYVDPIYFRYWG